MFLRIENSFIFYIIIFLHLFRSVMMHKIILVGKWRYFEVGALNSADWHLFILFIIFVPCKYYHTNVKLSQED